MSNSPPDSSAQRSILQEFVTHRVDLVDWLSPIADGRIPAGVFVPRDEHPLDHLIGVLRHSADREQTLALGKAAGALLARWLAVHGQDPHPGPKALERVRNILSILECVPAPPDVATDLYYFYRGEQLRNAGPDGHDIRRQALFALALSPPPARTAEDLARFFIQELDDPQYAAAAFGGLQDVSLTTAVEELPRLLRVLHDANVPPDESLWGLFRELELQPDAAAELSIVLAREPELQATAEQILRVDLNVPERFPHAWAAYQNARSMHHTPSTNGFSPLVAIDAASRQKIAGARELRRRHPTDLLAPQAA